MKKYDPIDRKKVSIRRRFATMTKIILCLICVQVILLGFSTPEVNAVNGRGNRDAAQADVKAKDLFDSLTSKQSPTRRESINLAQIDRKIYLDLAIEIMEEEDYSWEIRSDAAKLLGSICAVEAAPQLLTTATDFELDPKNTNNPASVEFYGAMKQIGYGMLPACINHIRKAKTEMDIRVSVMVYSIAMPSKALNVDRKEHLLYLLDQAKRNATDEIEIKNIAKAIEHAEGFLK